MNICTCPKTRKEYEKMKTVQYKTPLLHLCFVPGIVVGAGQSKVSKVQ